MPECLYHGGYRPWAGRTGGAGARDGENSVGNVNTIYQGGGEIRPFCYAMGALLFHLRGGWP